MFKSSMQKKLLAFGFLLMGLIAVSFFLLFKNQPRVISSRPLQALGESKIGKIIINEPGRNIVLEKNDQVWRLYTPVEDMVDSQVIDQLLGTLTSFTIGSVISEKKDKYSTFDLDDAKATHVRVFEQGKEAPVLDGFVGKQAVSYGNSYFRFADQDPVYIAGDLPNWVLIKPVEEYRLKKIFTADQEQVTKVEIKGEKFGFSCSKSSNTWATSHGNIIDQSTMSVLLGKLGLWEARQFVDQPDSSLKMGFEKPSLVVTVDAPSGVQMGIIGAKKIFPKSETDLNQRYAQSAGRKAILVIGTAAIEDVLALLKILPK